MGKLRVMYISNDSGQSGAIQSLKDMITGLCGNISPIVILPTQGAAEEWLVEKNVAYYVIPFSLAYGEMEKREKVNLDELFMDNYFAALRLAEIRYS